MEVRMLSLWQPWATLIALGIKQIETRHWHTSYCGLVAIHAAKRKMDRSGLELLQYLDLEELEGRAEELPYGAIVAVANLSDCKLMHCNNEQVPYFYYGGEPVYPSETEQICGWWEPGRFAWVFKKVQKIDPIQMRGKQGFPRICDSELICKLTAN